MGIRDEDARDENPTRRRRLTLRPLSAVVFVVLAAGSVGVSVMSSRVVQDQEERLLDRRAAEVGALFTQSASRIQEALRVTSTVATLTGVEQGPFTEAAQPAIAGGLFAGMGIVQSDGAGYRAVLAEGIDGGHVAVDVVRDALERAAPDGVFVSTPVFTDGAERRIAFASLVPRLTPRTLVYAEVLLKQPEPNERPREDRLFGDLTGAIYVGEKADASQAIIVSPGFDIDGGAPVARRPVAFGAGEWLLAVSPRGSLVGSLAERQPWLFLVGGLLATLLVTAMVEVLLRRRQFALALVDERTGQLQQSLTELDAAQERLVRQERLAAIGELASAVGHELRNPLGVLSNVFYLLGTRLDGDDPWIGRQLRTGEREVAAATLIVSDLLQYARPREPIFTDVDVPEIIDEVLSVASPPAGIALARQTPAELPPIQADRDQLRQVLLNLVTNAYDAMGGSGLLVVEAEAGPEGVTITVGDTGEGMDEDTRARLFEPFFTTKAKGIGLGLAVAHRIVAAHGGTFGVKSSPGTGTSFTLTLPTVLVATPSSR